MGTKDASGNELKHGYQPSGREERGYQPISNVSQPAPSTLPTTGSSATQPSASVSANNTGDKK